MQIDTIEKLKLACNTLTVVAEWVRHETNEVVGTNDHIEIIKHYDKLRQVNALIKESR